MLTVVKRWLDVLVFYTDSPFRGTTDVFDDLRYNAFYGGEEMNRVRNSLVWLSLALAVVIAPMCFGKASEVRKDSQDFAALRSFAKVKMKGRTTWGDSPKLSTAYRSGDWYLGVLEKDVEEGWEDSFLAKKVSGKFANLHVTSEPWEGAANGDAIFYDYRAVVDSKIPVDLLPKIPGIESIGVNRAVKSIKSGSGYFLEIYPNSGGSIQKLLSKAEGHLLRQKIDKSPRPQHGVKFHKTVIDQVAGIFKG